MKDLSLAWRLIRRDGSSAELRLLVLALALAIGSVTAVGFFTDRVDQALQHQAGAMLAADLVLAGNDPIPDSYRAEANRLGLRTARTLSFPSVVVQAQRTQLVEVKAVSPEYPLRGELRIRPALAEPEQLSNDTPQSSYLWVEAKLLVALGMDTGQSLSLGERHFEVAAVISRDTGEGSNLFRLGPRVLMSLEDIPSTGLVSPASRVRHRLLVAGPGSLIEQYRHWVAERIPQGISLQHMSNARPELRNALERGRRFLSLAALAAVLVAGAAVALATRQFVERNSDISAILRCLGASSSFVLHLLLLRLLLIGIVAGVVGMLVGYLAQLFLVHLIGDWFNTELPPPGWRPLGVALGTALATLIGFTLPPMLRLGSVSPLRVLRKDLTVRPPAYWVSGLCAFLAMALLMWWQAGESKLAAWVVGATLATLILLLTTARAMVLLLRPLRQRSGTLWRYALAGLARNPGLSAIQLTGFGLGMLAILLLATVRIDLLAAWQRTIPSEAPNQFLINIQSHEVPDLEQFLEQRQLDIAGIYPMLRARLTHINATAISPDDYVSDRAKRLVAREFNLSWAGMLQQGNQIVAGHWWGDKRSGEPIFSVEQGLAQSLGVQMGDELNFNLAGLSIRGRVGSLRTVRWDSFQPNFFVIGTPGLLQKYPATYITSFYLPPGQEQRISELVARFPAVTIIDTRAIMGQIREMMDRGALAAEYVFFFTLAAGLLVLYAGIQASGQSRRQESAILRTLGLQRNQLLLAVGFEFVTLGLLAGLLASACASLTGWVLSTELFELDYRFNPWLWIAGILGGGLGIGLAGVLATYPLVVRPPLQTLRSVDSN
ncbi:MAG: FtsX-like permease family protein [Gammaproteobacteria bacterium]|nr:FtsX-like permease family protein [Gammaproteobacteria bacterium]